MKNRRLKNPRHGISKTGRLKDLGRPGSQKSRGEMEDEIKHKDQMILAYERDQEYWAGILGYASDVRARCMRERGANLNKMASPMEYTIIYWSDLLGYPRHTGPAAMRERALNETDEPTPLELQIKKVNECWYHYKDLNTWYCRIIKYKKYKKALDKLNMAQGSLLSHIPNKTLEYDDK